MPRFHNGMTIFLVLFVGSVCRLLYSLPADLSPLSGEVSTRKTLPNQAELSEICEEWSQMANKWRNETTLTNIPSMTLRCDQLVRSIQQWETCSVNLYRLARLVQRLQNQEAVKALALGGSMTAGHDDVGGEGQPWPGLAWPARLTSMLQQIWPHFDLKNIAKGGYSDENILATQLPLIDGFAPDLIFGEFAVNNQVNYNEQWKRASEVNQTGYELLNILVHQPQEPAVVLVELFRTAGHDESDAAHHCGDYRIQANHGQWICEQWWMPQTWRQNATNFNSVATISYRDAVWPVLNEVPSDLNQYWDGLSHPIGTHTLVAENLLFAFFVMRRYSDRYIQCSDIVVPKLVGPDDACITPTMYLHSDSPDKTQFSIDNEQESGWHYYNDSRDKYGWIALTNSTDMRHVLRRQVLLGHEGKTILSFLSSYDERMATARVWYDEDTARSLNISSWHKEHTSVPTDFVLRTPNLAGKTVTINVELLLFTSKQRQSSFENGFDKFKLLGIITC